MKSAFGGGKGRESLRGKENTGKGGFSVPLIIFLKSFSEAFHILLVFIHRGVSKTVFVNF